jgi:hypothetical protein
VCVYVCVYVCAKKKLFFTLAQHFRLSNEKDINFKKGDAVNITYNELKTMLSVCTCLCVCVSVLNWLADNNRKFMSMSIGPISPHFLLSVHNLFEIYLLEEKAKKKKSSMAKPVECEKLIIIIRC